MKIKVGGNENARLWFESQPDYKKAMSLKEKYESKAAALFRDKVQNLGEIVRWNLGYYLGVRKCLVNRYVPC